MKKHLKFLTSRFASQRGDTIVEVSLALTVLALVLGTSSVLASRNTKTLQTSQENTYALRVAQGQLEYVKSYIATHSAAMPTATNAQFCMANATTKVTDLESNSCKKQNGGADYKIKIESSPSDDGYSVKAIVTWDTLTGTPGNIELMYRVYKKLGATIPTGEGDECPIGTSGPPECTPNTPQIQVTVRKIAPNSGEITPDCTKAATQTRAGASVRLSGATAPPVQTTSGTSTVLFTGLEPFGYYQAQVTGVPSGFQLCPPNVSSLTQARHDSVASLEFKMRPVCYQETRYTAPYMHYTAPYVHYTAPYDHYTVAYDHGGWWESWWAHVGPDARNQWLNDVYGYNTYQTIENGVYIEYRYEPSTPGRPFLYTRWQWTQVYHANIFADYLGYYGDSLGSYGDPIGVYGDPYTVNVCPS